MSTGFCVLEAAQLCIIDVPSIPGVDSKAGQGTGLHSSCAMASFSSHLTTSVSYSLLMAACPSPHQAVIISVWTKRRKAAMVVFPTCVGAFNLSIDGCKQRPHQQLSDWRALQGPISYFLLHAYNVCICKHLLNIAAM